MVDAVEHRGPDDMGAVFLNGARTTPEGPWRQGLGHRRLSIIDVSPSGHQPMMYRDRYWIVSNGEAYNYLELRAELERAGHRFRSTSDTEVILAAYAEWGTDCFARLRGMWGMLIVDLERRQAVLCRDRLGIKPLYLWRGPGLLAVASELKQFLALPGFRPVLELQAAAEYIATGYEKPNRSFLQEIEPVPAGTFRTISFADHNVGP